jgi:16S rRNA (cytosine967-C5)-methyltransferase
LALLSLFITLIESGLGTGNRAESALADLAFVVHPDEIEWLQRFGAIERDSLATLTRVNLPQWIWESLPHSVPQDQCLSLAEAMLKPAPLDLRVNTIKTQREDLMAVLGDLGGRYTPEPTPFAPHGIRLRGKPALQTQEFFKKGAAEVQDEGSQLLSMLLAPKRGEMVVDFCAGAGGKTLSLGAMMRSSGRLYAFDVSEKRLANLKPRLAKSGLSNVHPVWIDNENDIKVKRLAGKIDRVLVDAPCSGLGTLRRNPDLKWRQSPQSVAELTQKQLSILTSAARLLKPGGRLVYATCSLIYEENQGVVENFLKANPNYELKDPKEVLSGSFPMVDGLPVGSSQNSKWWQLFPHIHATDAFFGAVLEKKA